ncbi:UvrD-helicase domain-containing protein [Methylotenera sp.]|uniref:UvrD-helicase domain-containing protein n=1 Tax=Methylotenera sp. TaxID=2051956 RepID=UPI0025F5B288|nr:UvrD-helicase domain-containing protein [Methylotenera sp.]
MSRILKPTPEQMAIIESESDISVVNAGAGAAKTTTLEMFAKARPNARILYLAYNRSIKEEAIKKFPSNVKVLTSHQPAYAVFGRDYQHKMAGNIRPYSVLKALNLDRNRNIPSGATMVYAQRIVQTVEKFLTGIEPYVTLEDVVIDHGSPIERVHFDIADIANCANDLWSIMKDIKDERVPMVHDGYLKLFMLSGRQIGRYEYILFDESQDANPVTMQIVRNQQAKKIFVGDKNQAIYKFRGAVNAMEMIEGAKHFKLTGSFRFGPEIALAANKMLYLKDSDLYVDGLAPHGLVMVPDKEGYQIAGEQYMHLTRGAFSMLEEAIKQAELKKSISFIGGVEGYRFSRLDDVYAMKFGMEVKDPFIKLFESYDALTSYSESDRDMSSCIGLVETYGKELPAKLKLIQDRTVADTSQADVIFSTAHKAKGLEHKNISLSKDFYKSFNYTNHFNPDGSRVNFHEEEEMNIAYVAITRAKQMLVLPHDARELFTSDALTRDVIAQKSIRMNMVNTPELIIEHKKRRRNRAL